MAGTRKHQPERLRSAQRLEKGLPLRHRIFSKLALRRGLRRLRFALLVLAIVVALSGGLCYLATYAVDKAQNLSIDHISYTSRQRLISKEQALDILGITGPVNLTSVSASAMENKLTENLCIAAARVHVAPPDSLHIEVDERLPIVYVELENAAARGQRTKLFMGPDGILFPVVPEFHRNFLNVPTWYLHPSDVNELEPGAKIEEHNYGPILNLVAASNHYDIAEIPAIREIFRPKEWKIVLYLEDGTEVLMHVYDFNEQMDRLANILEHVRSQHSHAACINVMPRTNPVIDYRKDGDPQAEKDEKDDKNNKGRGKDRRPRRNR